MSVNVAFTLISKLRSAVSRPTAAIFLLCVISGTGWGQPPQLTPLPAEAEALLKNAQGLVTQGRVQDAVGVYEKILQVAPNAVPVLKDLAWLRATASDPAVRRPDEALRLAERAFEQLIISFNSRENRDAFPPNSDRMLLVQVGAALSAAHAAAGRFTNPLSPALSDLVAKGSITQALAGARAASEGGLSSDIVMTWSLEMAQELNRRNPTPQTQQAVQDLQAMRQMFLAGQSVQDGRPQPGLPR
jgi:tetratricopeptide (TPR) repeat protein